MNTLGERLQDIQRYEVLYQKVSNSLLSRPHCPNPGPLSASRTARVAGRGFAWWIAALDWLQEAGLRPMRRGGVVLGAGFPPPRRRVPGFLESPAAALLAPGSCCPSCSRPGDQTEHGLRHCGSGKTEPRPHPSVPLLARLPYGKGCLWLPAEKAREPGTSRQLGAPPRLGVGLGRGPGDRRSWEVFLPGLWWGAVG